MPRRSLRSLLPLVRAALVALLALASGTLECGGARQTAQEHRGERLFGLMCSVCHGPTGQGYAADQAPSLTHGDFLAAVEDAYLRVAILEGRGGTTMSAWSSFRSGPLSADDASAIVAYLRSYGERPPMKLDARPPVAGDAGRGAEVFTRECAVCHGAHGTEGPFVGIGGFDLLRAASDGFLRQAIRDGRPGTAMPSFARRLGDGDVDDVLALLRSWQKSAPAVRKPPAKLPPLPLGPLPIHPQGPEPKGFTVTPQSTKVEIVKAQLDAGARMALLDARAPSDYIGEHIAGAVSVPFYDPDPYFAQLPKDAWLVCYCSCPSAESGQLAQKLLKAGFTKVTVLEEGLRVWKAKKYPTNSGFEP